MTVTWKPQEERYGGGESCFGINFREDYPDIAKQLSDEKGFYVDKKEVVVDGYTYKARVVQNGKYVFVSRKATGGAAPAKQEHNAFHERDAQIQKNFEARLAFDKEVFEFNKQRFALDQATLATWVDLSHQMQIMVKAIIERKDLFTNANKLPAAKNDSTEVKTS